MRLGRAFLAVLLLGVAVHSALAATPPGRNGRTLLQSGVSCFAQIPACTARRCTTRILDSKETYVCLRCQRGYVPARGSDGRSIVQCVCPAGTYEVVTGSGATAVRSCQPCPTGSYCPGGDKNAKLPTDNIGGESKQCNPDGYDGLTTKSTKASRLADCVAKAGYVLPTSKNGPAQECTGNSYAPNYNRLKTCLPCQSGLAAPDNYIGTHADKNSVCQVPPGRFWELNVVRDCPKGQYRSSYVRTDNKTAINCLSCPEGWTTANTASPTIHQCNVMLPGYKLVDSTAGIEDGITIDPLADDFEPPSVEPCPVGFFNNGTTMACIKCPYGSTTLKNGSISADDCMVPPGYYARTNEGTDEMVKCPTTDENVAEEDLEEGYYRSGWKSYKEVISASGDGKDVCTKCGTGVLSRAVEDDELLTAEEDSKVAATSASCFIQAGWGMTFDPLDFNSYKAIRPCPNNTYGVNSETFGLFNAPCKACTKNLYSAAGSTHFTDCKNPGGFGYTSEGANQCPDGFWAARDSMNPCEPCPEGRTTYYQPGIGTYQDSLDDCIVPPGSGIYSSQSDDPWNPTTPNNTLPAKPCPVGFYAEGDVEGSNTTNPTCQACANHTSTINTGSTTCDACAAGYGKLDGSTDCTACTYGSYNYGGSESCNKCPSTTFNDPMGDGYTSYGLTFAPGAKGSDFCVPRYAQLPNPAGDRMALPDSMFTTTIVVNDQSTDELAVKACVEACPADKCCIAEMVKETDGVTCKHARLSPLDTDASDALARMYYKLPPSEMAAASAGKDKVEAKTMSSGIYAICNIDAWQSDAAAGLVGTSPNPLLVEAGRESIEWNAAGCTTADECKAACDASAPCWGFIWHPANGFALRGGEMFLGGRTFFVSPDGNGDASVLPFDMASNNWVKSA